MPLFYAADYGPLANYNMFFIVEKKWNTSINVWIRGPFRIG
eukprot:gene53348-42430_t